MDRIVGISIRSLELMALAADQSILSVTTKGVDVAGAIDQLKAQLDGYPEARITSLTHNISAWSGWSGKTTVVAVIEYTPSSLDGTGHPTK